MVDAFILFVAKITALVITFWALIATTPLPDANVLLNVFTVLLLVAFGPRYFKVSRLKAQVEELKSAYETAEISRKVTAEQLSGASTRADTAEARVTVLLQEISEWKARYDEQANYTAEPALVKIHTLIKENQDFYRGIISDNKTLISLLNDRLPEIHQPQPKETR